MARGEISLHGWFVDIHLGEVMGLDGVSGQFIPLRGDEPPPVALAAGRRLAMPADHPNAACPRPASTAPPAQPATFTPILRPRTWFLSARCRFAWAYPQHRDP